MNEKIYTPVKGFVKDITESVDEVFSEKMMGDGFIVEPSGGKVCSPCAGEVVSVFPTCHAVTLKSEDGTEILVHIGIDTVELDGQGFKRLITEGQKVKVGDPLNDVNWRKIVRKGYSTDTMVVVLDKNKTISKLNLHEKCTSPLCVLTL